MAELIKKTIIGRCICYSCGKEILFNNNPEYINCAFPCPHCGYIMHPNVRKNNDAYKDKKKKSK